MERHALEFQNPQLSAGQANVTVRRGTKWADRVTSGDTVNLMDVSVSPAVLIGTAVIESTVARTLRSMSDADLALEHDPACRTVAGLLAVLRQVYGEDFSEDETVTVVTFHPEYPTYDEYVHGVPVSEIEAASAIERSHQASIRGAIDGLVKGDQSKLEQLLGAQPNNIDNILAQVEKGMRERLLTLADQQPVQAKPFNAQELAERAVQMYHACLPIAMAISQHGEAGLTADILGRRVDAIQISQAITEAAAGIVAAIDRHTAALSPKS